MSKISERKDQWTNAVITLVIPLDDVTIADHWAEKQIAVANVLERVLDSLPTDIDAVASGKAEDVTE